MKCSKCRQKDIELLSSWERFKNWILNKFFQEEIIDLSQSKYTQGYGDGISKGKEWAEKDMKKYIKEMYKIEI